MAVPDGERLWTDVEPDAARRLLLAALDAFAQKGYFATTTREISQQAGMSPAAVYVHYVSKNEMLAEICRRGHAEVLADLERALEQPGTPTERVRRFVAVFAGFHARQRTLGRVMQYELRGLTPEQFREIADTRQRFEDLIRQELRAGVATGGLRDRGRRGHRGGDPVARDRRRTLARRAARSAQRRGARPVLRRPRRAHAARLTVPRGLTGVPEPHSVRPKQALSQTSTHE